MYDVNSFLGFSLKSGLENEVCVVVMFVYE